MMEENHMDELSTLKTIAETLNQANDLDLMLNDVLKKLLHVTGLQTGWIFLIDEKGRYKLSAHANLPPALSFKRMKPMCEGSCWCLDRYQDQRLTRAVNIINCKRIEDAIEFKWGDTQGISHHATVPLRAGDEKFGLLNVASPDKKQFSNEELALLESVAFQIGTAIKRINLAENEQKLALMAERNRLAQDLHDSVNQLLFSLTLTARAAKEMTTDENVLEMLSYMQELSQEALAEMRALIWQLRPKGLEEGIAVALNQYAKMLGLEATLDISGVKRLPNHIEEALWRIAQEALNNCKRHAGTKEVNVTVKRSQNKVDMTIQDEGHGFQYEDSLPLPSMGLSSMKERTEKLNGSFTIETKVGKGTAIHVTIPIA
ncbi:GAF domain-containing sensor histidine kinase [Bacillus kexueae]|uniref:GAF domain-containing sensor histidine kinase n=1 Tax=Aeribacillus kexueae TaxID=2078952 RepID=UPI0024359032|nr:GAF domain-containing sensor histidine kinase [Bacillus kexueae]